MLIIVIALLVISIASAVLQKPSTNLPHENIRNSQSQPAIGTTFRRLSDLHLDASSTILQQNSNVDEKLAYLIKYDWTLIAEFLALTYLLFNTILDHITSYKYHNKILPQCIMITSALAGFNIAKELISAKSVLDEDEAGTNTTAIIQEYK